MYRLNSLRILAVLGLIICLTAPVAFADDAEPDAPRASPFPPPGTSEQRVETVVRPKSSGRVRFSNRPASERAHPKRRGGEMPPAGSHATGGTSSSPGGLQQTPFGNP